MPSFSIGLMTQIAITGTLIDAGTYFKVPISIITGGVPTVNLEDRFISFSRTGDIGATGSTGATGPVGTKSLTDAVFTPRENQPPATAFATLDTRNSIAILDFDAATNESAIFLGIIPEAASLGSGLKIRIIWTATSATTGDTVWSTAIERMTTDIDVDSFDTAASVTTTTNATNGVPNYSEITLTTIDGVTAGDGFRIKITRDATNVADTMTGDAELIVVEVRSAA